MELNVEDFSIYYCRYYYDIIHLHFHIASSNHLHIRMGCHLIIVDFKIAEIIDFEDHYLIMYAASSQYGSRYQVVVMLSFSSRALLMKPVVIYIASWESCYYLAIDLIRC